MKKQEPPSFSTPTDRTVHNLDEHGFIRDWFISPSWSSPCDDLGRVLEAVGSPWGDEGRWTLTNGPDVAPLKSRLYKKRKIVTSQKVPTLLEGGAISWIAPGTKRADKGEWARHHVGSDGFVDWSIFCYTPEYRHSIMGTVIEVDQPEWRTLRIESTGPVALFINGKLHQLFEEFSYMQPVSHEIPLYLYSGTTDIHIATWQVAFREVRHVVRVSLQGLPVRVVLPAVGADEYKGAVAERILANLAVDRWSLDDGQVHILGPEGVALRISTKVGELVRSRVINGSATFNLADLKAANSGAGNSSKKVAGDLTASMLDVGEVFLQVRLDDDASKVYREFRVARIPAKIKMDKGEYDPEGWRDEVINHVASSFPSTAKIIANFMLDSQHIVTSVNLDPAFKMIDNRADCADFEAVGMMHLLHRIPKNNWAKGTRARVEKSLLNFKYWIDQPGLDAMCYFTENHQFVWHTAEMLAGEFFPTQTFTNAGWKGKEHADHGREMALEWMHRKLEGGFSEFDSNAYLAIDSLALVSIVEFAQNREVRQIAEALLDKILLSLASNSWKGIHGSAHGRSYTTTLRSSRFEETAPIMWGLWGMGALNNAVLPVMSLISAQKYKMPEIMRKVARDYESPWNGRQVYRGTYRFTSDLLERPYGSDIRVWRSENSMLSSVQDYRSGLPGLQEHIWGATLSSEVQIFTSYPAAYSHGSSVRPNAWAGHLILPRTRQHEESLICIYSIDEALIPNKTHLWFPLTWMDEYRQQGSWLIGCKGDGYIAVSTEGGFDPLLNGDTAHSEWIARGDGAAYCVTVGGVDVNGSFDNFIKSLQEPIFSGSSRSKSVSWTRSNETRLDLSWKGAFAVNGIIQDLDESGVPEIPVRLQNPSTRVGASESLMRVEFKGEVLELDLLKGKRITPASGT
jgi:hypothetical protein